jgi:hypothetical protein
MKRSEVRDFLEYGIIALTDVTYGSGRISEFNSNRNRVYPMCWIEPLSVSTELSNGQLPYDNWSVRIRIVKKDAADSVETQYEALVDECDYMAQQLIHEYNTIVNENETITFKKVTIDAITREPIIKKNADDVTGVLLSFTLRAPDTTNLC